MAANSKNNIFQNVLELQRTGRSKLYKWSEIESSLKSLDFTVIEYFQHKTLGKIILFESDIVTYGSNWSKSINELLELYESRKGNKKIKKQLPKRLKSIGAIVPMDDILSSKSDILESALKVLAQWIQHHDIYDTFTQLLNQGKKELDQKLPVPLLFTLSLVEDFINMILQNKNDIISNLKVINGWFENILDTEEISNYLNLFQFLYTAILSIESWIMNTAMVLTIHPIEKNLSKEVAEFWDPIRDLIFEHIRNIKESKNNRFAFEDIPDFISTLKILIKEDIDLIRTIHYTKYAKSKYPIHYSRLKGILEPKKEKKSFIDVVSEIFSTNSVLEKVREVYVFNNATHKISIFSKQDFINTDYLRTSIKDLKISDIVELIDESQLNYAAIEKKEIKQSLSTSIDHYIKSICNIICSPIYLWKESKELQFPSINMISKDVNKEVLQYKKDKYFHEKEEVKNLEIQIENIKAIYSLTELEKYQQNQPKFRYYANQVRWDLAIEHQLSIIHYQRRFKLRKMKELGITDDIKIDDANKEKYFNEMLNIENEIRRYVPFVTSAFMSALPERKTVEFDPYRHQTDGIEFDPETTMDPEKWMTGRIMKTLKNKIEKGEVTQVNSFCLDLSGSMDHERMRNLYKVLFLLVSGLESRKSYDSFHFFSNNFIPGVDFDGNFTNKSLLFRILLKISNIVGSRVVYRGIEGTNISGGIKGCAKSLNEFVAQLKQKEPSINISCSMFVITDGEPSMGIRDIEKLNKFVEETRQSSNIAIKGIFIKSSEDDKEIIARIFGAENSVETKDFDEGVQKLISIMAKTYKTQREEFKWEKRRQRLSINNQTNS